MKASIISLTLFAVIGTGVAQGSGPTLSVTGIIKAERYCRIDDELTDMITLQLEVVNTGDTSVVIYPPVYPSVLISRTTRDLKSGKHELELHPPERGLSVAGKTTMTDDRPKDIITRGQHYQTHAQLGIPIFEVRRQSVGLKPGSHYLSFDLTLDSDGTNVVRGTSRPVMITVPETPNISACP